MNDQQLTDQHLDEIEDRAAALYEFATVTDPEGQDALDALAGTDVPALIETIRRLRQQRRLLLASIARKDAESGAGDKALREFLGAVETHVVADGSDDPEHIDDCPGCEPARP